MTQYGSSSDRPRGRRARHGSDAQDWGGYDSAPQDDREFPDLSPIRPAGAGARDARQDNPAAAGGRHSAGGASAGGGQYGGGQYAGGRHSSGGGQYAGGQPPWDTGASSPSLSAPSLSAPQAAPPAGRHSTAQPAAPDQPRGRRGKVDGGRPQEPREPRGAQGPPRPQGSQGLGWDDEADSDDPMAAFSERWRKRGEENPADGKKRKRFWYLAGGGVAVIVIALVAYFTIGGGGGASNTGIGDLVTTFLPGEMQQVPDACTSVPAATISQVLPGKQEKASPPMNTGAQSQCTWTLDNAPTYRVLEVNVNAYSPSGLASGDGSATFAAEDAYAQAQQTKANPASGSGQPKGTVANLPGLGSSAFSSMQVFSQGGSVTDMATVYVRYRNVLIQVVLNGVDKSSTGKAYGPVSQSALLSQAKTVAQQVTSKVTSS